MAEKDDIDELMLHIAMLRERAEHARRLAREVRDTLASRGLLEHAEEYDRHAAEIEARVAVLKQAAQPTSSEPNIAALKPPDE
jgi:hypothetical protein